MIEEFLGQKVVLDLGSPFVCFGRLIAFDEHFFDIRDGDLHDLRDTQTTRENYVVSCRRTGIKHNRKRVLVARRDVIAVALFKDVIDE
jgi:hypothetical protein